MANALRKQHHAVSRSEVIQRNQFHQQTGSESEGCCEEKTKGCRNGEKEPVVLDCCGDGGYSGTAKNQTDGVEVADGDCWEVANPAQAHLKTVQLNYL